MGRSAPGGQRARSSSCFAIGNGHLELCVRCARRTATRPVGGCCCGGGLKPRPKTSQTARRRPNCPRAWHCIEPWPTSRATTAEMTGRAAASGRMVCARLPWAARHDSAAGGVMVRLGLLQNLAPHTTSACEATHARHSSSYLCSLRANGHRQHLGALAIDCVRPPVLVAHDGGRLPDAGQRCAWVAAPRRDVGSRLGAATPLVPPVTAEPLRVELAAKCGTKRNKENREGQ